MARFGHRLVVSGMTTPRRRLRQLLRSCLTRHPTPELPNEESSSSSSDEEEEEEKIEEEEEEVEIEEKVEEPIQDEIFEEKEEELDQKEEEVEEEDMTPHDFFSRLRRAIIAGHQDIALALAYEAPADAQDNEMVRALRQSDWFGAVCAAQPSEREQSESMPSISFLTPLPSSEDSTNIGRSILNAINAGSILPNEVRALLNLDLREIFAHASPLDLIEMRLNASSHRAQPVSKENLKCLKRYSCVETSINSSCTVCMDMVTKSEDVIELPCKHIFHEVCIEKWFQSRNTCPNCRFVVNSDSVV
jgi:hypothetical protein